jgi:hypothetical protein
MKKEDIDELMKELTIELMERYHSGSIASLKSLKGMLLSYGKDSIEVRELTDEIIPGCIEIVKEERENLRKEIENETYEDKYLKDKVIPN